MHSGRRASGFSVVEALVSLTILLGVGLGFTRTLLLARGHVRASRERALALEAAQTTLEELAERSLADLVGRGSEGGADELPAPPPTTFRVAGLAPVEGDSDGFVGEVLLPLAAGELREDLRAPELGMPLDLDADGTIDDADHRADCVVLPVLVRVAWQGPHGPQRVELGTVLANR